MTEAIDLYTYHSPIGNILLGATSIHLVLCDWPDAEGNPRPEIAKRLQRYGIAFPPFKGGQGRVPALLEEAKHQLNEYFSGKRRDFTLPIQTFGTPFQQQVWQQLQTIPYGQTMTYKQQAAVLGCPRAIRAVANANRLNALSILIPCHRVLGTSSRPLREGWGGSLLTGYAGGIDRKRWLLTHEQQHSIGDK